MTEAQRLSRAIDLIARKCPRGIAALRGVAPMPSDGELDAAVLYYPKDDSCSSRSGASTDGDANKACTLADFKADLGLVSWDRIVFSVRWYRANRLTIRDWEIYEHYIGNTLIPLSRLGDGGLLEDIAKERLIDVKTVRRVIGRVPVGIAKIALSGIQLPLNVD